MSNDIAVIGMACRFPGADDVRAFWENLAAGRIAIGEVPAARWRWQDFGVEIEDGGCRTRWGAFLDDVESFDREFFGLSAREAAPMDPQQRMALELAWTCFEHAGVRPSRLAGQPVGVFVGGANLDYKELIESEDAIDAHYATGIGASLLSNRLSFLFDLTGPSVSVDTACSSALSAIHAAVCALRNGECSMALAGGVSLLLTPRRYLCFSKARMLSPSGRVKSFDGAADGMVRGEGGGLILLKPLADALAGGNNILGVIKGSAVNHGGRTRSLTYPSAEAQADVIRRACRNAGVAPRDVNYIEAHGTATPKGDPIEIAGLLDSLGDADVPCRIGTAKVNVGHLEAAAGIAGVIKVLLSLQHEALPPLAGFESLNPLVTLDGTRFEIAQHAQRWESPRVAGVSAFGFAGTNGHVIVAEAPAVQRAEAQYADEHILCLSAKTPAALARKKADMLRWLDGEGRGFELGAICAALVHGRDHFEHRVAVVARDRDEMIERLSRDDAASHPLADSYRNGDDPATWGVYAPAVVASLPTYPFERTHCWIASRRAKSEAKPTGIRLRPLADAPEAAPELSLDALLEQLYRGELDAEQVFVKVDRSVS